MSSHDETPTTELPAVQVPDIRPSRGAGALARKLMGGKRIGIVALAGAVTLGVAGIALGAGAGDNHVATASVRQYAHLPTQVAPRTGSSRASRGGQRTAAPSPTGASAAPSATRKAKPKAPAWVAPMKGFHLTSCYGMRWGRIHQGIDFAVTYGAPIFAVHAGTVVIAGFNTGGYGNMVLIRHGPNLFTLYGHASRIFVHVGQKVATGQRIALEGATGHVTGPHMHFEVWTGMWQRIEPGAFLAKQGIHLNRCQ